MNWKPYAASVATVGLATYAGANVAAMNTPDSAATIWNWLGYGVLPFLGSVGSGVFGAMQGGGSVPAATATEQQHLRGLADIYWEARDFKRLDILKTLTGEAKP